MNPEKKRVWIGMLILATGLGTGFARSDKARKIDEYIHPFAEAGHFSGVVLASESGRVIYEKAFGLANADFKVPNRLDTRFGIASITKLMTQVILNRLIDERKIGPADPVSKFIPDFPEGGKITVEMLARHRSGIPHRVMPPEAESQAYASAEFVEKVKAAKLEFEPGTQRLYSSAGYSVLARILEIVSARPYARLLQDDVFGPAGMTDSLDFDGEMIMERRAQDYLLEAGGWINAPLKDYSFLVGAGSVFGTARDVHRFGLAVVNGTFGERTRADLFGSKAFTASGSTNGHRAELEIALGKKYGYVLVSNLNCGSIDRILSAVGAILQDKDPGPAIVPAPKITAETVAGPGDCAGVYRREDGTRMEISLRRGRLYSGEIRLHPIGPDLYFEFKYYGTVRFPRDAAGRVARMEWTGPGFSLIGVRL